MKKLLQLSLVMLVVGCATLPPLIRDIRKEQVINANFSRVWVPINNFFSERKIPVKTVLTTAGMLQTEAIKVPYDNYAYDSKYCDCGTLGGIYVYREILGSFTVTVKGLTKNTTSVSIDAEYRAAFWAGNTFKGWVRCESKGVVEDAFLQTLSSVFKEPSKGKEQDGEKEGLEGIGDPTIIDLPL